MSFRLALEGFKAPFGLTSGRLLLNSRFPLKRIDAPFGLISGRFRGDMVRQGYSLGPARGVFLVRPQDMDHI